MSTAKTIPPPAPPDEDVTYVPNHIFQRGLTFDAIGLYLTILSLYAPHERFFQADLIRYSTDGEYVTRSAFRELQRAGLLKYRGRGGTRPGYWHEERPPTAEEKAAARARARTQRRP